MINHRPTPAQILARKLEIKRRYATKTKVGRRSRSMAAIRLAQLTRWLHDANGDGAELAHSERSVEIVRIFVHHMASLPDAPRRITSWLADYAPWIKGADRERLITEVATCPLKWTARKLGWKLRLTDAQRSRLKITTISPIDVTDEQLKARRKAQRNALMRALRARRKADRVNTI